MSNYSAVAPRLIGSLNKWEYAFDHLPYSFNNIKDTEHCALEYWGHDDFLIFEQNDTGLCIAIIIDGRRNTLKSKEYGDMVKLIAEDQRF